MKARITRALCAAAIAVAFPAMAHAQATFTWEGLGNGAVPAPQDGVALGNVTNTGGVGYWQATNQGAGNAFGVSGAGLGCNTTPGGSNCGYNGNAVPVNMYSTSPTGTFTLNSAYFMSLPANSGWTGAPSLTATGYGVGGTPLFTQFISLTETPTLTTFNWQGVNSVLFTPTVPAGANGAYFLTDNLTINNAISTPTTTTPEPSSIALLGSGLVGLVPMLRRKRGA
jgi:hypothetical protein